jgi:cholesterol transport system auxiliary component
MILRPLLVCLLLGSCALASKSDPWTVRYFSPESAGAEHGGAGQHADGRAAPLRLRLGRVSAGSHLRQTLAFRTAGHELGYYEDRRWTEQPQVYLRRALSRALFEQHGVVRVVSGGAPTLEVELTAFEEIKGTPRRARMQAVVLLHDQRVGRVERTVTVERPIAATNDGDSADALAAGLGDALDQGVEEIAKLVLTAIARHAEQTGATQR